MEATIDYVDRFLNDFKLKMKIWDIVFRNDRLKNIKTLVELEITEIQRRKVIENLTHENYSEGPLPDTLNFFRLCGYLANW